jgi:hypothetical protein
MKEKLLSFYRLLILAMNATKDNQTAKENLQIEAVKKVLNIKYTPDFIGEDFIIETKGRANESFPLRWKMFKYLMQPYK